MSLTVHSESTITLAARQKGKVAASSCCVYLITSEPRLTKIGMSNDPVRRLAGLRTSTSERLEIAHQWRLKSREQAAQLEARLHAVFAWAKVRREWFGVEPRYVAAVTEHFIAGREDEAEVLAFVLSQEWGDSNRLDAAMREHGALNPRWKKERRDELCDHMDREGELAAYWFAEAIRLGLPADEWDKFLAGL